MQIVSESQDAEKCDDNCEQLIDLYLIRFCFVIITLNTKQSEINVTVEEKSMQTTAGTRGDKDLSGSKVMTVNRDIASEEC